MPPVGDSQIPTVPLYFMNTGLHPVLNCNCHTITAQKLVTGSHGRAYCFDTPGLNIHNLDTSRTVIAPYGNTRYQQYLDGPGNCIAPQMSQINLFRSVLRSNGQLRLRWLASLQNILQNSTLYSGLYSIYRACLENSVTNVFITFNLNLLYS